MQFQKLSSPSLKELFVEEIEKKILSGELKVGEKLPSERELASSMQVSRAVVNAGIAELEKKGFLVVKPRIGNFVEDYRRNGTFETFMSIMKSQGSQSSAENVKSILELLVVIVQLSASLTIQSASDEELQSLIPILEACRNSQTQEQLIENTFHIYHETAYISKNALLPLLFSSFKNLLYKFWESFVVVYDKQYLIRSNEIFIECLLTRDTEKMICCIKAATNQSLEQLAKLPKEQQIFGTITDHINP